MSTRIAMGRPRSVLDAMRAPLDPDAAVAALEGARFDWLVVGDVLERSREPERLLSTLASHLAPDGHAAVPLGGAWAGRHAGRAVRDAGLETLRIEQNVLVARRPPGRGPLSLTVGMLTMDEEGSVASMIGEIRAVAPDAKILCVDSSSDRTPAIAEGLGARVLRQLPARGHGPAMELLMYAAAGESEVLVYLDCDFTYPTSLIPALRRLVEEEGVDVVNCARTRTRQEAMPLPNFLANRAFAAAAYAMHGVPTCDVHSGMRAYRSSVIRAFDFEGRGDALPIDTLLFPAKCGYRVLELEVSYAERVGTSKLRKLSGTVWTGIRLVRALGVGRRTRLRYEVR